MPVASRPAGADARDIERPAVACPGAHSPPNHTAHAGESRPPFGRCGAHPQSRRRAGHEHGDSGRHQLRLEARLGAKRSKRGPHCLL
jgi:hypothetical protein